MQPPRRPLRVELETRTEACKRHIHCLGNRLNQLSVAKCLHSDVDCSTTGVSELDIVICLRLPLTDCKHCRGTRYVRGRRGHEAPLDIIESVAIWRGGMKKTQYCVKQK